MKVRIYKPAKTAMQQSGQASNNRWVIRFAEQSGLYTDPLMGWTGGRDTTQQLRLSFESEAEAVEYAKRNGLEYELKEPEQREIKPKSYAVNFAYNRVLDTYKPS